jgi:prepilin-type N-terminal cleavage/methylation domain-containing protein
MKKMNKKAFTLIELLIVIAIIGILFIVLVSKVDFATDKAKATGVQTDFRSFQMAFETVAKEKAGFNSYGWNSGDYTAEADVTNLLAELGSKTGKTYTAYTNRAADAGDRVRNSYDEGDLNLDGECGTGETFTGRKIYTETWDENTYYTLVKPGTTFAVEGFDKAVIFELETAINKNLDPKLHISIDAKDGKITMANGAQDPWNTQYEGYLMSNVEDDQLDRGAIIMYSFGANQKGGCTQVTEDGEVTVTVPGNNKQGADDYSIATIYTYKNGYGEVISTTTGFSNNQ